ncbi:secretin N-terminal domain-containing protein [Vibrio genomosp. F6]|uniref:Type II secretory pathway protein n=1 Tax=Vibrio genomosp. F6 str. FF-238 TaxID=1191298 RepID=A0A1E5CLA0_9VIBR|nr:secretin N-terminal domain-containing protein [Vibrio genomosp. F6]OEE69467.1 type II secretory pathway protein [Vibrio genomosp. F6 str. FF-238]
MNLLLLSFFTKITKKNTYCAGGKLPSLASLTKRCGKPKEQNKTPYKFIISRSLVSVFCSRFSTSSVIALLFVSLFTPFSSAQDLDIPYPAPVFESKDTPISDFISWFAKQTGQKVVLGHGVTGSVSFTAPDLKPDEYASFFVSVLNSHGYELIGDNGIYTVLVDADSVQAIEPSIVKLYRLQNVRNSKVVELMGSMLKATQTQTIKNQPLQNYDVEILPTTNAIIITGSSKQIEKIDALIQGIDRPQKQVFIEAIITEQEIGDSKEVGVNLEAAFTNAGFTTQPTPINKLKDSFFIFDNGDFSALVKAVSTNKNTELLSRPNMLIMDRERGYITVGQNVPFLVSSEVTDGGNTIQQIERKDVGVSLEVVPHVMGDSVVLVINQESSSVTDSAAAADIITNKRTLTTVVKVKDNQTIALGGLISTEDRDSVSGVPLLMDIPWLGAAFRSDKKEIIKKELRVVIKTTIL